MDVDISGWQLWDAGADDWFTFPANTVIPAGGLVVVVVGVQGGGSCPGGPSCSLFFTAGRGNSVLNNSNDNVVLLDPGANEYIQLFYNAGGSNNPATYTGFPATATRVGVIEDWGNDMDGNSIARVPDGSTNISVPACGSASPGDFNDPAGACPILVTIPTMGEWALFLMGLILFTWFNLMMVNAQQITVSNGQLSASLSRFVFVQATYKIAFKHAIGLALIGMILIHIIWGTIVLADLLGMGITIPILAYLIHLWMEE